MVLRLILKNISSFLFLLILAAWISACSPGGGETTPASTSTVTVPASTETPIPPTPTQAPLALNVNGEGYLLEDYHADLQRLQSALTETGMTLTADEARQRVLDEITEQMLLAAAARKNGFAMDDAKYQQQMAQLIQQAGGEGALNEWKTAQGYSEESFQRSIRLAAEAAWQRDQIIQSVPKKAEQIHGRQILVLDSGLADTIHQRLENGNDFTGLAFAYDPLAGGELGWFPRGYLTQPDLEAAAFQLQAGQYTPVIKTSFGYHILLVIERSPERELSPDALKTMQRKALSEWLQKQKAESKIEVLV